MVSNPLQLIRRSVLDLKDRTEAVAKLRHASAAAGASLRGLLAKRGGSAAVESPQMTDVALPDNLPRIPPGKRVYAIGDIHGRADLLEKILDGIALEEQRRPPAETFEIFLGDMINRGPDTRGVLDLLLQRPRNRERIILRGNHEAAMLRFFHNPATFPQWVKMGGLFTLASYGIDARLMGDIPDPLELRSRLLEVLPPAHTRLLVDTKFYSVCGDYVFVHAGLRPHVALQDQIEDDLLWIREPFLSLNGAPGGGVFSHHVVHGHSPRESVEIRAHRTNIDTGAYFSDRLTCLVLEDDRRESFATKRRA